MDRKLLVVKFDQLIPNAQAWTEEISHGSDIEGVNVCAVLYGDLCKSGKCRWCENLRHRCQSHRIA